MDVQPFMCASQTKCSSFLSRLVTGSEVTHQLVICQNQT